MLASDEMPHRLRSYHQQRAPWLRQDGIQLRLSVRRLHLLVLREHCRQSLGCSARRQPGLWLGWSLHSQRRSLSPPDSTHPRRRPPCQTQQKPCPENSSTQRASRSSSSPLPRPRLHTATPRQHHHRRQRQDPKASLEPALPPSTLFFSHRPNNLRGGRRLRRRKPNHSRPPPLQRLLHPRPALPRRPAPFVLGLRVPSHQS